VLNELIIVRYGEIGLKAKETKRRFENTLIQNIKKALKSKNIYIEIKKERGRIFIHTNKINSSIDILKKIFGIVSISPAVKTNENINSISDLSIKIIEENLENKNSFALRVRRTGDHTYNSQEVAIKVGNDIVKKTNLKVDLTNPDIELFIEIRDKDTYIYKKKIKCVKGLPLGTQGNILALINNKNSILAAWYMMKRGCKPIFFVTNNKIIETLKIFIKKWYAEEKIITNKSDENKYKAIKKIVKNYKCQALITNHNIYQSKSVIKQLKTLKNQIEIPVFYPLISLEKKEIDNKIKEIGLTS